MRNERKRKRRKEREDGPQTHPRPCRPPAPTVESEVRRGFELTKEKMAISREGQARIRFLETTEKGTNREEGREQGQLEARLSFPRSFDTQRKETLTSSSC